MSEGALRIFVPRDWSSDRLVAGLQSVIVKALSAPLPQTEQARARAAFERLQLRFRVQVHAIFGEFADVSHEGTPGLKLRTHQRSIAQLNALFGQSYEQAMHLGLMAGGAGRGLSENELKIVKRLRLNENAYAGNFLTDIANGEGTMPYGARADLYANALQEAYWQGYLYADLSADRFVRWVMQHGVGFRETENCVDCALLSGNLRGLGEAQRQVVEGSERQVGGRWGNGIYQARELAQMGIMPQSGKLACTTHCHCKLVHAERPLGKPRGKAQKTFRSLRPKHFTGTERDEHGRVVVTRAEQQERRKRYARKAEQTEHRHLGRSGR